MTFPHAMPFGAELRRDGVRFRLWAPAARGVEVVLGVDGGRDVAMEPGGDGWFEAFVAGVQAGLVYKYRIDGGIEVPDPASRFQPTDAHGPSAVIDPEAYSWKHPDWRGRPWHEAVIYEAHVGAFSPEGTFEGLRRRLDHLVDLGVTALELMPIADFPGRRNWGYDGVLPFAPDSAYGTPEDLKRLIDDAHACGLMLLLDVVYNHFGPDGNYLHVYAPQFFTDRFSTPWGAAIDYGRREVRDFVIHNALYWLEEFRFDGLRLDAVHAIIDERSPDILQELAETVHRHIGTNRHVHLVLENERNDAHRLERDSRGRPQHYVAQWNDDIHHAFHVLATGEGDAYYADFVENPLDRLGRCLAEGFAFQGEPFAHLEGAERGEPSDHLPPAAFIGFLQNHDQVGNRAMGDRIVTLTLPEVLRAMAAILLVAPAPPLLFMGEEWGAAEPFLFFCDFHDELADSVREGRRREFAKFPAFRDPRVRERIPDPNAESTFLRSRLDWGGIGSVDGAAWLGLYRKLLGIRHREVAPRLAGMPGNAGAWQRFGLTGLRVDWRLGDGTRLVLTVNLGGQAALVPSIDPAWRTIAATTPEAEMDAAGGTLPPWSVVWYLDDAANIKTGPKSLGDDA